ncbi:iron-containing alcohol dehydrogenase [Iocasia frigidifontis]|uniref:Iron-containing alcohol dehydrogenase n=1 Tax=Iocasia fonsfrigidae TaxID=2682810 RepID=A0A8A7KGF7_9FIRM|nr:iron-containing alcohol dehydrogenase [Iocasia fonsfrigidae]QTL98798.1 iron-containing alcohol dehydrogenase [Iocasia fonsfrigidae]
MNPFNFEFQIKTKIKFGRGMIQELSESIYLFNINKIMIVVDHGIIDAGILSQITKVMDEEHINYFIFDKVKPDPTLAIVNEGLAFALENEIEGLIAVGGGSPIDTAKAIRTTFLSQKLNKGLKNKNLPLFTIPTTSGSGSEVTKAIVITDENSKRKFTAMDESLAPDLTIVDPELTKSLPQYLTAIGGMDALSHCIESYVSQNAVLPFEMIATKGIELVRKFLRPAVGNGSNMKAREGMSLASLFGGISLTNCGLGLVHAIAHPLGGKFKIPHGMVNTLLLPHVMKYNIISNPPKFAYIAELLGISISEMTEMEAAYQSVEEIKKLIEDIGLSTTLSQLGVPRDSFDELVNLTMEEKLMLNSNPRPVKKNDILKILKEAY